MVSYISILPESCNQVICVRVDGPITADDYSTIFLPEVRERTDRYGEFRLLVHYSNFRGWMPEAVAEDMESVARYARYMKRFALVNPPRSEMMNHKLKHAPFNREVKSYANDQFVEALDWVRG